MTADTASVTALASFPSESRQNSVSIDIDARDQDYFSELLGYPADRLTREPDLLRGEQEQLASQIQETAVANYRSFIATAQCLTGLQRDLGEMAAALDALVADLPKLQAASDAFRTRGTALSTKRESMRQLYASQATVLELLEIPALLDTCIRSGNFDEALDIRAQVNKLAVVHGDLNIVRQLISDVAEASKTMLEQLLGRLTVAIQLPECIRIIGYVRRLAAFQESDLRLQFLQRRELYIASLVADLDDRSPYEFLKRLTDVYRLDVFDVAMQYRAIFADRDTSWMTVESARSLGAATAQAPGTGTLDDGGILDSWSRRRMAAYVDALQLHLPRVPDGGALASVLDHVMYCGTSLGRVGLDFRPLVAPLFEYAALQLFTRGMEASCEALESTIAGYKWITLPSSRSVNRQMAAKPTDGKDTHQAGLATGGPIDEGGEGKNGDEADDAQVRSPPTSLMEHAPLAAYANGLLSALNELRHCAPLAVQRPAVTALYNSLLRGAKALSQVSGSRTLSDTEFVAFQAACAAYAATLAPYIIGCFDRVYPGAASLINSQSIAVVFEKATQDDGDPIQSK